MSLCLTSQPRPPRSHSRNSQQLTKLCIDLSFISLIKIRRPVSITASCCCLEPTSHSITPHHPSLLRHSIIPHHGHPQDHLAGEDPPRERRQHRLQPCSSCQVRHCSCCSHVCTTFITLQSSSHPTNPPVSSSVIMKLLAFTLGMIVIPIGSYFATVDTVFKGTSTLHPILSPFPISLSTLSPPNPNHQPSTSTCPIKTQKKKKIPILTLGLRQLNLRRCSRSHHGQRSADRVHLRGDGRGPVRAAGAVKRSQEGPLKPGRGTTRIPTLPDGICT